MLDLTADKQAIRRAARKMRDALAPHLRQARSARIVHHLQAALGARSEWQRVGLFVPFGSEVDITPLRDFCNACGRSAYAPRLAGAQADLCFVRLDAQTVWRRATGGYQEPQGAGVEADTLDVILVPGLLFDDRGYRLGYGGGHYDRALSNSSVDTVGVGFAVQRVDYVPTEAHDIALGALVDETGICLCTGPSPQTIAPPRDFT